MDPRPELAANYSTIRLLLDDYVRFYASRDKRLMTYFSDDCVGFTGGGDRLVKGGAAWISTLQQDFSQFKDPVRIEYKEIDIQSLSETTAVATGFYALHLPVQDGIRAIETIRLVLVFRRETSGWKITHSSASMPYQMAGKDEILPLKELVSKNEFLEAQVAERTAQLSMANHELQKTNENLTRAMAEYRQAADALQKSEGTYKSILLASPDDITITDRDGRILMVSPVALKMFGCGLKKEFLGLPITDFLVPEDRARALSRIATKFDGAGTGLNEYRGLRPDGSTLDIEVNSEFIRDSGGAVSGMVLIIRDITDRKQAETEMKKLEAKNRRLEKAESLDRMAGAIAHHLNNQLQTVMMSLEMAMSDLPQNATESDVNMKTAKQAAGNAAEIGNLMLTYLGQTAAECEVLDLSNACEQTLYLLRNALPKAVVWETDLPSPGPIVLADPNQIQQVITNLIINAWEADGGVRGMIRLATKTVPVEDIPVAFRFPVDLQLREGAYACLEVADVGAGIAEHEMEKIFDPFFSSKFFGRGMGLAVVLGIVRTHDGAITVESVPGHGSVFRVFLPVLRQTSSEKITGR